MLSSQIKSKTLLSSENCLKCSSGAAVIFNTESVYHYYKNKDYRAYVDNANYMSIDGAAIALVFRLFGLNITRFHGPDLMMHLLSNKSSVYKIIAGGSSSNRVLVSNWGLDCYMDLPFSNDVDHIAEVVVERLCGMNFDGSKDIVLFISLGLPKQEAVALRVWSLLKSANYIYLNKLLILPVGAAADFLTGEKKRAGIWWRRLGLEWLPRLVREPRMFPRVIRSFKGIFLFARQELMRKFVASRY